MVPSAKVIANSREVGVRQAAIIQKMRDFLGFFCEFFKGRFCSESIKEIAEGEGPLSFLSGQLSDFSEG
ncbi:MAG: hypothetical protein ACO3FQ_08375 [Terrimicrobiaceae bacterium]